MAELTVKLNLNKRSEELIESANDDCNKLAVMFFRSLHIDFHISYRYHWLDIARIAKV
jgi:hypothetical protein